MIYWVITEFPKLEVHKIILVILVKKKKKEKDCNTPDSGVIDGNGE